MKYFIRLPWLLLICALLAALLTGCIAVTMPEDAAGNEGSQTQSDPNGDSSSDTPSFSALDELKDYLLEQTAKGETKIDFIYTGKQREIANCNFAQMLCAVSVRVLEKGDREGHYALRVFEYPGDRMLEAYRSGDDSALSADERSALERAVEVVEEAKAETDSPLALELYLHDWICENAVYSDDLSTEVEDPADPPHRLTALGVLLDGEVICQGYTDAFYLLASMAGLEVDRQAGVTEEGRLHMFNTVCIDGAWYIVDTTHDDGVWLDREGNPITGYLLFNAGLDRCTHEWDAVEARQPISAQSGEAYFFGFPADGSEYGYQKSFDDLGELARSVMQAYAGEEDRDEFHLLLVGEQSDSNELFEALEDAARAEEIAYSCSAAYAVSGENTYFYLFFE